MLCLLVASAIAAEIPLWSLNEDFGQNGQTLANNGWMAGYGDDDWQGWYGYAYPETDDNVDDANFPGYHSGTAADNWLVRRGEVDVEDGIVEVVYLTDDNDALGLVSHSSGDALYLLVATEDGAPPPIYRIDGAGGRLILYRIEGGSADLLASENININGQEHSMGLASDDGELTAWFGDQEVIQVTDEAPLQAGAAGFYSYDAGGGDSAFASIFVAQFDGDDDGVADDEDNCEDDANADQADGDGDGIGDVCDDSTSGGDDTGNTGVGDDTGPGGDNGNGSADGGDVVVINGATCGCAASPSPEALGLSGLLLLGLAIRRRR